MATEVSPYDKLEKKRLAEALSERVRELEEANRTIQSFNAQLEGKVAQATSELAQHVNELQVSRGRLNAVIDSMEDGLVFYEKDGRLFRTNNFMLSLFNVSAEAMAGRTPAEVAKITGEPVLDVDEAIPSGHGQPAEGAVFEVSGQRKRFIRRVVSPVVDDGALVHGLVVIYQDVTDQKEVEQLKDDFLSITSHELKTPLTSIMGYAQLLARRLSPEARSSGSEDVIQVIEDQCRRMKRLVDDLLDVSRIDRGTLAAARNVVRLSELVRTVAAKFQVTNPKHQFRVEDGVGEISVWGDEDRLDQVLTNLLSNAVKYSPDGGPVEVRLTRNGESAELVIQDWGIGIPADQQQRIFSRFYQAETVVRSRRFSGMGLGLFISKAIIDELGGSITVDSAVGKGSTFAFTLPLHKR